MSNTVKLTTRGRYAIMAMVELAKNGEEKPTPLSDIADKGNISLSYLEQLIAGLRRQKLVKSYRGPGGGYSLAKPASDIMVSDILIAAEDSTPAKRNSKNETSKAGQCEITNKLWDHIGHILYNTLSGLSLAQLLDDAVDLRIAA